VVDTEGDVVGDGGARSRRVREAMGGPATGVELLVSGGAQLCMFIRFVCRKSTE